MAEPQQLWGHETELARQNFVISARRVPLGVIHALAAIKAEAAMANVALGQERPSARSAEAIVSAAGAVERGEHDEQFVLDVFQTGSGTSTNMNVNEVVAALASAALGEAVHPNDDVNASQSSNDVFPSAVAIAAVRMIVEELLPAIDVLHTSLSLAASRFAAIVKPGRTHLMDAVPVTLGAEFGGHAALLAEGAERIEDSLARLGRLPLGGTAVGNGLNAPPGFASRVIAALAARLALPLSEAPNHFAAQSSRDPLVEMSGQLRTLGASLMKIANDVRWMASGPAAGLGEIRLPELQAGSSIMPGKVNPVMSEMVTQVVVQVYGNDAAIAFAGSQGAFELNTFQPVMAANLLDSIHLLARACRVFAERCVDGIEADEERCAQLVQATPAAAAALNRELGYDRVAALVKQAVAQRRPLLDVVVESGALTRERASELLDVSTIARGG